MSHVSKHMTTLDLCNMESEERLLDFSGCSALQNLRIRYSTLLVQHILSPSVKKLTIRHCNFKGDARARISVPNLIVFKLVVYSGFTPPGNMPQLECQHSSGILTLTLIIAKQDSRLGVVPMLQARGVLVTGRG